MNVRIYGERLRDARVVQGLLSKDVADRAELAPSQLTRLEHAQYSDVVQDTAEKLAKALAFPETFLTFKPVAAIKPGSTLFRARKSMTRREEEQLQSWARLAASVFVTSVSRVDIPHFSLPSFGDFGDAAAAAEATRRAFGLNLLGAIPHVMRAAERAGIPIVALQFDSDIARHDAFSCWAMEGEDSLAEWPLMLVRALDSWERTRFSVAHEIGHLVMHRSGIRDEHESEQQAHDFARHFLLPVDALKSKWPEVPTLNNLMHIKAEYGISLSAVIEHAWRVSLIDESRRTNFYKQLSNRREPKTGLRWREREPGWDDREPERPRLVARMTEAIYGEGLRVTEISPPVGYWPALYLRRVLASQVWSGKTRSGTVLESNVVALNRREA